MSTGFRSSVTPHPKGECATHPLAHPDGRLDEESELRGFELGAADYIHKPVRAVIVRSRSRARLDAKEPRSRLRRQNREMARTARWRARSRRGTRELAAAQLQMLQSEKMASVGQPADARGAAGMLTQAGTEVRIRWSKALREAVAPAPIAMMICL
jgi:DNA-binding response OmpR family regulator